MALIAAALLLFAQSAAAAHYHPRPVTAHPSLATVMNAETGQCALCLLAFHFPGNSSATAAVVRPYPT
ncbi:MAG: hypothetical protein ACREPW_04660, partial [Candidatus Binataceae bacterium]